MVHAIKKARRGEAGLFEEEVLCYVHDLESNEKNNEHYRVVACLSGIRFCGERA